MATDEVRTGELSAIELANLADLESTVDNNLNSAEASVKEAGDALRAIHKDGLYRAHGTFEQYVKARFDMSRSSAYKLLDYAQLFEMCTTVHIKPPAKASHARAAAKHMKNDPEKALAIVQSAQAAADAAGVPATAKHFEAAETEIEATALPTPQTTPKPPNNELKLKVSAWVKAGEKLANVNIHDLRLRVDEEIRPKLVSLRALIDDMLVIEVAPSKTKQTVSQTVSEIGQTVIPKGAVAATERLIKENIPAAAFVS